MDDMGKLDGLVQRKGYYSLRVCVPKDVQTVLGKKQIWRSLSTKNYKEARIRYSQTLAAIEGEFDLARTKKAQPDMLSGYSDLQLERLAVRWFAEKNQNQHKVHEYSHLSEADLRDAYVSLQMEYQLYKDEADGISKEDVHYGMSAASEYLEALSLTYAPKSKAFQKLGAMFSRAMAESCFRKIRYWDNRPYLARDPLFSVSIASLGALPVQSSDGIKKRTLRQLREEYMSDPAKHRGQSTQKNYVIILRVLEEMLGEDRCVHEITREDCKKVRELLTKMPSNAQKRAPGITIQKAIELAEKNGWPKLSPSTINTHMSKLNALFSYADEEGYIYKNPAKNLYVKDMVKDKDKRDPFSVEQLQVLFNAPLYTGCKNDGAGINTIGDQHPRNAKFWIPLISLWTGMRLNEICQLEVSDISKKDGVDIILICLEGEEEEKRVKTEAGVRFVPIHPELKKIGFMEYVEKMKNNKGHRLFPELKKGAEGYYSANFSKWFSRFLKQNKIKEKKIVFHSFRHSYRDALREAEMPVEAAKQLGGWSNGSTDGNYGSGLKASTLYKHISNLGYEGLDLSHLYSHH